jgi:D-cysteine desulfhydrase family pyridoxal phosphate-dependent enzyme
MTASSISPDALRAAIDRLPRIQLAQLPTPLDECPRLTEAIGGPRIMMKRDDLTGLAFGGNKTRKFDFTFADALREGADCVITGAASQSNHARQAAAAAAKLGMKAYLVNRYDAKAREGIQGNLLLDCILGAEVRLADGPNQGAVREKLVEELRAAGRRPYVIGHHAAVLGTVAYINCVLEIAEQLGGRRMDVIALCSGSGTHAGVALGVKALGLGARVIGYRPGRGEDARVRESVARMANEAAELLDLPTRLEPGEVENRGDYVGEDYGITTPAAIEAIQLVARTEGILIDPVYVGKAMSGVIGDVRRGDIPASGAVVFLHTGGTPALFAYQRELAEHVGGQVKVIEDVARGVL